MNKEEKKAGLIGPMLFSLGMWCGAAWCLLSLTGCTGIGLRHGIDLYRIDERQESSRTYNKPTGLRCLFTDCTKNEEVQGS